ncbi:3-hydroxyacyl-ACP dehydratase [Dyadobacter psychrotolerans]|uniref:3-hydroxyacyl-ACP dehydratase n=1 Tax=Dyadobacter psychrotolerans TaxID=2541721 RepID=A0A4R5DBJ8_9BACT|nr:3-hydroxyacyl-ACP dehydratase [Dyadobacter psychrotolerans]TDE10277.1 3-hydroxyacyl-ACP dehydratase [Dyadobacter psychrotolerans]
MFLNDLYTVLSLNSTAETISAEIRIDESHPVFAGHFPGSPITPGVVQLQIVKEVLEIHLRRKLGMKTMRSCKFLQVINPIETPVITIAIKFEDKEQFLEVIASANHSGNVYLKAQMSYFTL